MDFSDLSYTHFLISDALNDKWGIWLATNHKFWCYFFVSRQLSYLKSEFERWMLLSLALEIDTPMLKIKSCTSRFFFVWIFRVQTGDRDSFDRLQTLSPYQCLKRYVNFKDDITNWFNVMEYLIHRRRRIYIPVVVTSISSPFRPNVTFRIRLINGVGQRSHLICFPWQSLWTRELISMSSN